MARPKKQPVDPLEGKISKPVDKDLDTAPVYSSDLCIDSLLSNAMRIVSDEIACIRKEAAIGKLAPENSRDLVAYTKLLYDIKNDSSDALEEYTDEELMALTSK